MMNRSREERDGTIVYVGGLLHEIQKEEIEDEFKRFGPLLRVWVAFNPPGFAFVEFTRKEDAESAVKALHNATVLGSKVRVEISRGRSKSSRGPSSSSTPSRGGRGGPRGNRDSDFGPRGFGGGRPSPYERNGQRGRGGMGSRFNDFESRRRPEFNDRDYPRRGMGAPLRDIDIDRPRFGGGRDFRDIDEIRGFGDRDIGGRDIGGRDIRDIGGRDIRDIGGRDLGGRDFPPRGDIGGRDFPTRDIGGRDFPPRELGGGRDFPTRDIGNIPPRDISEREFMPRSFSREFGDSREFGIDREPVNGVRGFGNNGLEGSFGGRDLNNSRDFPISQPPLSGRDFGGPPRDVRGRDYGDNELGRDFGANRDIGFRREPARDFNAPRDLADSRDFGGRPPQALDADRFGSGRDGFGDRGGMLRPGGFDDGRFAGGDIGGSGNFDDFGARDRFRTRSPIPRGRPLY